MVKQELYHCEAGSNSIRILEPGGILVVVRSSIRGILGTAEHETMDSCSGFRVFARDLGVGVVRQGRSVCGRSPGGLEVRPDRVLGLDL